MYLYNIIETRHLSLTFSQSFFCHQHCWQRHS